MENVLITDEESLSVKLIDFGLSKIFNSELMNSKIGTPYYIAPEVLEGSYDMSCDLWSLGVITYWLICGCPPFHDLSEVKLYRKILVCDFDFHEEHWSDISITAQNFIRGLLQPNLNTRMTSI